MWGPQTHIEQSSDSGIGTNPDEKDNKEKSRRNSSQNIWEGFQRKYHISKLILQCPQNNIRPQYILLGPHWSSIRRCLYNRHNLGNMRYGTTIRTRSQQVYRQAELHLSGMRSTPSQKSSSDHLRERKTILAD